MHSVVTTLHPSRYSTIMQKKPISRIERYAFQEFYEKNYEHLAALDKEVLLQLWHDGFNFAVKVATDRETMPREKWAAFMPYFTERDR